MFRLSTSSRVARVGGRGSLSSDGTFSVSADVSSADSDPWAFPFASRSVNAWRISSSPEVSTNFLEILPLKTTH